MSDQTEAQPNLSAAVEAICMVSDEPVSAEQMAAVLEVSEQMINEICEGLAADYAASGRGFVLVNVAGGWRFQSATEQAAYVEKFVLDGQSARMSGAALETLAIIAYKQPISRAQMAAIRGVNVDGVLKTLQQRGYVTSTGQIEGAGQAQFFGTTGLFLEKLGIASLDDLPPLGEFFPDHDLVEALEQGLRPASAIDLNDDDAIEKVLSEEVDAPMEAEEPAVDEVVVDIREDAPASESTEESDSEANKRFGFLRR